MKDFWNRLMLSGAVIALVSIAAILLVNLLRAKEVARIAEKNIKLRESFGYDLVDQRNRQEKLNAEVANVCKMQEEEIINAWKNRFN